MTDIGVVKAWVCGGGLEEVNRKKGDLINSFNIKDKKIQGMGAPYYLCSTYTY